MMWTTTPIVLASGARHDETRTGVGLPRATAGTFAAAREAAPLTLDEAACILVGLHPCTPDEGDDLALVEHKRRVLAKLEADLGRGDISDPLTLHEAVRWAKGVGLPIPPELAAPIQVEEASQSEVIDGCSTLRSNGVAHYDPKLDALARLVAAELKAQGKKPSKKALARELKRRFNLPLDEASIIRRIRAHP
jgi:hypothetical protein